MLSILYLLSSYILQIVFFSVHQTTLSILKPRSIGSLMRGSWLLRKAWKIYQSTYAHLYERFMLLHGEQYNMPRTNHYISIRINIFSLATHVNLYPAMPSNYHKPMPRSKSDMHYANSTTTASATTAAVPNTLYSPTSPSQLYNNRSPIIDVIQPSTSDPFTGSTSIRQSHPPQPEALSACDDLLDQPLHTRPTHLALLSSNPASTCNRRFRSAEPLTCPTERSSTVFHSPLPTDRHGNRQRRQPHDGYDLNIHLAKYL